VPFDLDAPESAAAFCNQRSIIHFFAVQKSNTPLLSTVVSSMAVCAVAIIKPKRQSSIKSNFYALF
jgi:hypothetical protein